MNDKELIEKAAKAAGIAGAWGKEGFIEQNEGFIPTGWRRRWNPIDSDGDAFRLATKLRMMVAVGPLTITAAGRSGHVEYVNCERHETDIDVDTATRLAILRLAAHEGGLTK